jgi:predicted anti-sigma-YlaC factor YlaD
MNCGDYRLSVSALVDNECQGEDIQKTFAHLAACAECRDFYEHVIALKRRFHAVESEFPTKMLDRRVLVATGSKVFHLPYWAKKRISLPAPLAWAALLLVLMGAGAVVARLSPSGIPVSEPGVVYVTTLPVVEVEAPLN